MTLYYPDISAYDPGITLHGAHAVCIKVTEGTGYLNPLFASQRSQARVVGAVAFDYHFLHQGNASLQARWCHSHAVLDAVMVDFEPYPAIGSRPTLADCVAWIDAYRALGGITHLVYLPRWYWAELGSPSLEPLIQRKMALVSSDYQAYSDSNSAVGWQSYGRMTPQIWQYTSSMRFGGIGNVDFNAFRGSYAGKEDPASVAATIHELQQLLTTGSFGTVPPPPPPPPPPVTMVRIPVTFGERANDAIDHIEAAGLVVTNTNPERNPADAYLSVGSVPEGGTLVPKGSHVVLNVRLA